MAERYQVPRGTQDIYGSDLNKWKQVEERIRHIAEKYGYKEIRTPIFEATEVFAGENDSSDMVNKEMYTFTDNGNRSLTLRPEGTKGIIRSFVEHKMYGNSADFPIKLYYIGPMFRYDRPQKGRYRQFHQFGIEAIGVKSPLLDVESIALGYEITKSFGIENVRILINTLGYKVLIPAPKATADTTYLYCKGSGASAKGFVSSGGFTVVAGSTVSDHTVPSLETRGKTYYNLRKVLEGDGTITDGAFTRDYEFKAPSAASAVILGHTSNGNVDWKTENGIKLKDL